MLRKFRRTIPFFASSVSTRLRFQIELNVFCCILASVSCHGDFVVLASHNMCQTIAYIMLKFFLHNIAITGRLMVRVLARYLEG